MAIKYEGENVTIWVVTDPKDLESPTAESIVKKTTVGDMLDSALNESTTTKVLGVYESEDKALDDAKLAIESLQSTDTTTVTPRGIRESKDLDDSLVAMMTESIADVPTSKTVLQESDFETAHGMFKSLIYVMSNDLEMAEDDGWSSKTVRTLKDYIGRMKRVERKVKAATFSDDQLGELGAIITAMMDEFWEDEGDYGPTLTLYGKAVKLFEKGAK